MSRVLQFLMGVLVIYLVIRLAWMIYYLKQRRDQGASPQRFRKPTMFDVRRLIIQGKRDSAVKLYREIFGVRDDQAIREVDELERGVLKKKP